MANGAALEERRMALHDLLDRILVNRAEHPDAHRRVYHHEAYLRSWFLDRPGWRLLSAPGVYRLERLPARVLPGRGLPRLRAPIDYACLCWALWFAETRSAGSQDWFVISELAREVAAVAGGRFSLGERRHREGLVRALQLLEDLGVLGHRDGDAEGWISGQATADAPADVMYDFAAAAPRLLAHFDPASLDALSTATPGSHSLPDVGTAVAPLARAWRLLLLGPMLWQGDDPEAFAALCDRSEEVRSSLEQTLGWDLELGAHCARIWRLTTARQAGSVLLDLVPDPGADGADRHIRYAFHPILLLMGAVRAQVAAGRLPVAADGGVAITGGALRDLLFDLHRQHRHNWGAELGEQMRFEEVAAGVCERMRSMGYLRGPDALDRCCLLPVAAAVDGAYAAAATDPTPLRRGAPARPRPGTAPAAAPPRQFSLFDLETTSGPEDEA